MKTIWIKISHPELADMIVDTGLETYSQVDEWFYETFLQKVCNHPAYDDDTDVRSIFLDLCNWEYKPVKVLDKHEAIKTLEEDLSSIEDRMTLDEAEKEFKETYIPNIPRTDTEWMFRSWAVFLDELARDGRITDDDAENWKCPVSTEYLLKRGNSYWEDDE